MGYKFESEAITQAVREAELDAWENDSDIATLRLFLMILCWSGSLLFLAIPCGISIAYACTFPDEVAIQWIKGWLTDLLIGAFVVESGSVIASLFLGWLYNKYHRCKLEKASNEARVFAETE